MGFGPAQGPFDQQRVDAKKHELEHLERGPTGVSQAKYDDKLNQEQVAAAAGHGPGPVERFKRWFSTRF